MKPKTFSLMGERCSGTNWVQLLILKNFDIAETRYPGFKHWPDYRKARPKNHVTIYLVRNSLDWLRSFYNLPHYVRRRTKTINTFMFNTPFISMRSKKETVKQDRNMETQGLYKDLWDMRSSKHLYWLKKSENYDFYDLFLDLSKEVPNYINLRKWWPAIDLWVRYEDVLEDPTKFLDFFSKKLCLPKKSLTYDLLADSYKSKKMNNFNQSVHKAKQLFNCPLEAAKYLKNSMGKPIGILVLTTLLQSSLEKRMNYDVFYRKVLDELMLFP